MVTWVDELYFQVLKFMVDTFLRFTGYVFCETPNTVGQSPAVSLRSFRSIVLAA